VRIYKYSSPNPPRSTLDTTRYNDIIIIVFGGGCVYIRPRDKYLYTPINRLLVCKAHVCLSLSAECYLRCKTVRDAARTQERYIIIRRTHTLRILIIYRGAQCVYIYKYVSITIITRRSPTVSALLYNNNNNNNV